MAIDSATITLTGCPVDEARPFCLTLPSLTNWSTNKPSGIAPDWRNVRFFDSAGEELPHWVQDCKKGIIWIQSPKVDRYSGTTCNITIGTGYSPLRYGRKPEDVRGLYAGVNPAYTDTVGVWLKKVTIIKGDDTVTPTDGWSTLRWCHLGRIVADGDGNAIDFFTGGDTSETSGSKGTMLNISTDKGKTWGTARWVMFENNGWPGGINGNGFQSWSAPWYNEDDGYIYAVIASTGSPEPVTIVGDGVGGEPDQGWFCVRSNDVANGYASWEYRTAGGWSANITEAVKQDVLDLTNSTVGNNDVIHLGNGYVAWTRHKIIGQSSEGSGVQSYVTVSKDDCTEHTTYGMAPLNTAMAISEEVALANDPVIAGKVWAFSRSVGHVYVSYSSDYCQTWSQWEATEIPCPVSKVSALTLSDGRLILCGNDNTSLSTVGSGRGTRETLAVWVLDRAAGYKTAIGRFYVNSTGPTEPGISAEVPSAPQYPSMCEIDKTLIVNFSHPPSQTLNNDHRSQFCVTMPISTLYNWQTCYGVGSGTDGQVFQRDENGEPCLVFKYRNQGIAGPPLCLFGKALPMHHVVDIGLDSAGYPSNNHDWYQIVLRDGDAGQTQLSGNPVLSIGRYGPVNFYGSLRASNSGSSAGAYSASLSALNADLRRLYKIVEQDTNQFVTAVVQSAPSSVTVRMPPNTETKTAVASAVSSHASAPVFTVPSGHGITAGQFVQPSGFAGGTWNTINGNTYVCTATTATSVTLQTINSTGLGTYTDGSGTLTALPYYYNLPNPIGTYLRGTFCLGNYRGYTETDQGSIMRTGGGYDLRIYSVGIGYNPVYNADVTGSIA